MHTAPAELGAESQHTKTTADEVESVRAAELASELRRAWTEQDSTAAVRLLRELGRSSAYSSRKLARMLRITPRHLQRMFARTLGQAPQTWLNDERFRAAEQKLRTANSVKEVAHEFGFRHVPQFSRDFRRHFGLAPSSMLTKRRRSHGQRRFNRPHDD